MVINKVEEDTGNVKRGEDDEQRPGGDFCDDDEQILLQAETTKTRTKGGGK